MDYPTPRPVDAGSDRPFTTQEALAAGLSRRNLVDAVRRQHLKRPFRGVYVRPDWPDDLDHRAVVAAAVLRDDQVFIDRTAAWLHGVDAFSLAEIEAGPRVETAVITTTRASRADGVLGRKRDLAAKDVSTRHGVRLTTPLRTALDLACNLRRAEALGALDAFARQHRVTHADLRVEVPRFRGRRGVVQARELIGLLDARAESMRESRLRLVILDAGLPAPVPQHHVQISGHDFWLDLAYAARRVAIEYDGAEFHGSRDQAHHDEWRRDLLREAGWTVIVVRSGDFTGERLATWLGELRRSLAGGYTTLRW